MFRQRFPIKLRSGEFPGHVLLSQKRFTFSWHHCWASVDVRAGAPSGWKVGSDIPGTVLFVRAEQLLVSHARLESRDFCRTCDIVPCVERPLLGDHAQIGQRLGSHGPPHHDLSRVLRNKRGGTEALSFAHTRSFERVLQFEHGLVTSDDPTDVLRLQFLSF